MHSLINCDTKVPMPHHPLSCSNGRLIPSLIFEYNPKKRGRPQYKTAVILGRYADLAEVRSSPKLGRNLDSSWCCWCTPSEGDVELEEEIMDFMAKSAKPAMFPTKEDLIRAGRLDLVEAIKKRGGWYSFGWDDDNVENDEKDVDVMEFQRRVESCKQSAVSEEDYILTFSEDDDSEDCFSSDVDSVSANLDSLQSAASSSMDRSLEIVAEEDSGIDGILSRLEKQRNIDFGIRKNGNETQFKSNDEGEDRHCDTSSGFEGKTDLEEKGRLTPGDHHKFTLDSGGGNTKHYTEPDTWRTWSSRRAGFQNTEFEEISFGKNGVDTSKGSYHDGTTVTTKEYAGVWDQLKEINYNEIQTRLFDLESELSTALFSLRDKREDSTSEEVTGSSGELSDALEFQENELMSARDRLRSIKAKLVVLEGKMAFAKIEAQITPGLNQKIQKRRKASQKAFQLLRTTCIVWPNSASEVLLAGSFDGWTTQRKMQKSKYGVFSVTLKLYPGKYEIKFIVDGKWKVDPLRPIVNHGGYENNLFIVT